MTSRVRYVTELAGAACAVRDTWLAMMNGTCSRQPIAQPTVTAFSRIRCGTTIARAASSGAKSRASGLEATVANATTAATEAPAHERGRHSTAQNSATSR